MLTTSPPTLDRAALAPPSRRILPATSLADILLERAETEEGTAFRFLCKDAMDWTYQDLAAAAGGFAVRLDDRCAVGGRVVLAVEPGPAFVAALFGIMLAGATAIPVPAPSGARARARLATIVADCAPDAIIVEPRQADRVRELTDSGTDVIAAELRYHTHFATGRPAEPAIVQYTSGSTGDPRGVVLSQDNLLSNCRALHDAMGWEGDRVGCTWLPPYHDMGLLGAIILAVYGGWPLVVMSPAQFVQRPVDWLRVIGDHGATITVAPNFALDLCVESVPAEEVETLDLSSLRQVYCGAEPVRAATLRAFERHFAPAGFRGGVLSPCYGLAEATLFVAGKPVGTAVQVASVDGVEVASCGRVALAHKVTVVDPRTRRAMPDGVVGEIWVSGPSVAPGYWGHDTGDATFGARLDSPDADGRAYLRTGDLGFLRGGELFVSGRIKDVIVVAGRNLHAHDVERAVHEACPEIRRCAAFAAPTGDGAERLVVAAEIRRKQAPPPEDLARLRRAVTAAVIAQHGLAPDQVVIVPIGAIQTTTSGKNRRALVRQDFAAGTLSAFPTSPRRTP